jgi:hypothetical protein
MSIYKCLYCTMKMAISHVIRYKYLSDALIYGLENIAYQFQLYKSNDSYITLYLPLQI